MTEQISLIVNFFGALRAYGDSISLTVPPSSTNAFIKEEIKQKLGAEAHLLVDDAVLANETEILPPEAMIMQTGSLSLLPPVCGG